MTLGQRIRQARLEKGLSQRQLCGDMITRNMLSLIENGSARPSMDTLLYLCTKLEKPVGYFLEDAAVSPNQSRILQARDAFPEDALDILKEYRTPDPVFDPEYYLLTVRCCMALAEQALDTGRPGLAGTLLDQAAQAGAATMYYTPQMEQQRLLLCHRAGHGSALQLAQKLPDNTQELLLRASAALETGAAVRGAEILDAAESRDAHWHFLRGEAYRLQGEYKSAAACYERAESYAPLQVYARLEQCYKELEDYKQAYYYACKQRT